MTIAKLANNCATPYHGQNPRILDYRRYIRYDITPGVDRGGGGGPSGEFILAETLVHNGTAGDNGTAGVTVSLPVLGFLAG